MHRRRPLSPGILSALHARRIAVFALYWGPIIFLACTIALVIELWKGVTLGGVFYAGVVLLAVLGVASGWTLQRRLGEITQALERAQRTATVGLVTAGFAHEMKNALTVVLGFAELARTAAERTPRPDPKVARHLVELEGETRRTVAQLQSFLSYASGEKVARRTCDPNALVEEALQMIRPMARMKDLVVDVDAGTPPRVECDPFALRQLFLNVLLNALDFARHRIVVRTAATNGAALISIADDGPGVPQQDRERIFHRFVTTRAGGNGLGLSTSREIAEAHGGSLTLEDTPGGGATFVLRVPVES